MGLCQPLPDGVSDAGPTALSSVVYTRFAREESEMGDRAIHNPFPSHARSLRAPNADYARRSGACIRTLHADGPYVGTNITGATGSTEAQRGALKALGAVEAVEDTAELIMTSQEPLARET